MYVCIYIYVSPHATDLTKKSGHHLIEYPHISLFASSVVGVGCGGFVRSSSTCKLEVSSKSYIRFWFDFSDKNIYIKEFLLA